VSDDPTASVTQLLTASLKLCLVLVMSVMCHLFHQIPWPSLVSCSMRVNVIT